ncbi:nitroreductase family protein [Nocardia sp. BMG51109]|uniref:nitroreductase family protein n=1 Tax=Nocardia sp. BMG51109 TaxID=1056816 RepID=UPI0004BADBD3
MLRAFEEAFHDHAEDPGYGAEPALWSARHADPAGVPARNAVVVVDATVRPFSNPVLSQAVVRDIGATDRMLVLSTTGDDRVSWLRAGEAASAVLLTATTLGLATCALTEPLESPGIRDRIRTDVLDDSGFPQLIVRMGWAANGSRPVPAPRRSLEDVLRPL